MSVRKSLGCWAFTPRQWCRYRLTWYAACHTCFRVVCIWQAIRRKLGLGLRWTLGSNLFVTWLNDTRPEIADVRRWIPLYLSGYGSETDFCILRPLAVNFRKRIREQNGRLCNLHSWTVFFLSSLTKRSVISSHKRPRTEQNNLSFTKNVQEFCAALVDVYAKLKEIHCLRTSAVLCWIGRQLRSGRKDKHLVCSWDTMHSSG